MWKRFKFPFQRYQTCLYLASFPSGQNRRKKRTPSDCFFGDFAYWVNAIWRLVCNFDAHITFLEGFWNCSSVLYCNIYVHICNVYFLISPLITVKSQQYEWNWMIMKVLFFRVFISFIIRPHKTLLLMTCYCYTIIIICMD